MALLAEEPSTERQPKPVKLKNERATLSYVPVEVPTRKRSAKASQSFLRSVGATLKTEAPIAYRNRELPAGTYAMTIESTGSKEWFLVIAPPKKPAKKVAEKKKGSKRQSKAKESSPKESGKKAPKLQLRVPLTLTTEKSKAEQLTFEFRDVDKGKKLLIVIRAGVSKLKGRVTWKEKK